ncbi:uncharacterized protein LOC125246135 isoform X2 [Megalobrama amblycephala]|uniref:uncharacterized protein LOC125246135 isoform X2 n=1 Tax=Megalobrama amblycephala TaxID=75352 RepID=UPI002013D0D6|nr:uncharacterized protein LOC125246135 isoform X2 [Megalobrama amblycephala]
MDRSVAMIVALLCVFLLDGTLPSVQAERHSLYYIYTALSKPVDQPGIYEFSAMGLLDDTQIDYYNSKENRKIPKQSWMKEKMQEDYWERGTQSRKSKEQWFNVNINILMNRVNHSESDLHVLQWRHGCEVEQQGDEVKFSKGIDEYGYDGEDFLSFDINKSQWVAPVVAAIPTKRKWDNVPILNQYTKGYLEKECVDWLNKFRGYGDEKLRNSYPPNVYVIEKKNTNDETKLKLTCLTTGFYPKDVMMSIRKYRTSLPEDEIESTGIRPNHDGSFQMRKSVEIKKEEKDEYDCFVSHKSIKEPVIAKLGQPIELSNASAADAEESLLKKKSDGRKSGETLDISAAVSLEKAKPKRHSLYYIYTALSKPVDQPGIYEFTAMGLLDDTQIDYYNSEEKRRIPKQQWIREKLQEDYWEKGTQSRKYKEQWFNVSINILMSRMNQSKSDLHVLQWRHGCEVELQGDEVKFSKGIDEYGYDGEDFLYFDINQSQWVAQVNKALITKRKWDNVPILNQYIKGYLEKECVDWLNKFREYGDEKLRNGSPPNVYVIEKKNTNDKTKLKLTCMATGFYPKDVMMSIRKNHTSLPEDEIKSTKIRPNHDGSFQMRKSVEIKKDEKDEYDCFVYHKSIKEPVIAKLGQAIELSNASAADAEESLLKKKSDGRKSGETLDIRAAVSLEKAKPKKHSLYYIYTALSKPVDLPGIYEFTAMGLLDDTQIDYYNSEEKRKIPKQQWMKENLQEDYWEKGTQSRKYKEQWFNVNINIVIDRMNQSESDLHVLQWRHGCEVEQQGDEVKFSKGIDEYGYDGENFLSFDINESQWVAQINKALITKIKWDNVPILNQYTKGYLEKECVDWLNKFREYGDKKLRNGSPPNVYVIEKKNTNDETKLKLTCLATGFYPKDVMMIIRKNQTSLPEDEIESTKIRPNHDGSFQMRKSVEIKKDEKDEYDCFVYHKSIKEPVIAKLGQPIELSNASAADAEESLLKKKSDGRKSGETLDISAAVSLEKAKPKRHSLYYIYTALSKPVDLPGIYEFSAMGLLDDTQIDYYNSEEKRRIPKQQWMKEKMQEDYWEKGTESRKRKEQWFNVNVHILMNRMNQSESDLHVLQWRVGCEVEQEGDEFKFSKGIDEYGYDGENFLAFDDKESQWVAPVEAALPTKRKWDSVPILNQYTKGYLEKECVDWLNKFREYGDEKLRNGSPPNVYVIEKKNTNDETKLKLTCLATGFYPKDVMMIIRKNHTSLPEDEIESTGIRPNHDGSFQMRKSVEIKKEEKDEYDCFVYHKSIKEPIIVKRDGQ